MKQLHQNTEDRKQTMTEMYNEHGIIMPALKRLLAHLDSDDDPRRVARDTLELYLRTIQPHSRREEEELLRKNRDIDAEGLRLSHKRLEEACNELEKAFFTPGLSLSMLKEKTRVFLEENVNHLREEENQYFVTDLNEIYERAGSY